MEARRHDFDGFDAASEIYVEAKEICRALYAVSPIESECDFARVLQFLRKSKRNEFASAERFTEIAVVY